MNLQSLNPEYLWLLALLPLVWLGASRLGAIESGRRYTILALRTIIITLLVLALARLEITTNSRDMAVYFVLDRSDSVPPEVREASTGVIAGMLEKKRANDEAGLVAFAAGPSIESLALRTFQFDGQVRSALETARTDIASALRLALSAVPNNRMARLVLLSDGNENAGSALEVARLARNAGVPIDVVPLRYDQREDVKIDKLIVPQQTISDAPFDLKLFLSSEKATRGTLRIFEDGQQIVEQQIDIDAGKNPPLVLPRRLTKEPGGDNFHRYRAVVDVAGDVRSQNNQGEAFTLLKSEPVVLYVEGDLLAGPGAARENWLAGALQLEQIQVRLISPLEFPATIEELQSYDSIILSNVAASDLTQTQMQAVERAVHDLGIGLVMIGGENSFGAGGWQGSPVELALPVSMDVKQRKVLPNGALAIVLHTCEIPSGNSWAREISIASLNVLSAQDYFGIAYFGQQIQGKGTGMAGGMGGWGHYWLWDAPLKQKQESEREMRALIRQVQPMDMPTFDETITLAYEELKEIKAQAKHIVVISDGDPAPPSKATINGIRDEGITVSAVAIAPHSGQTVETLQQMAYWGAGNFYYPKSASELPRIFIKEASIVRRSLIFEEPFMPVADAPSETLEGLTALPQLGGYVVTSTKDLSTVALRTDKDDPLLAHWRYGLGKTVAFTSDAKNKWASQWVDWQQFSQFWSQTVRWSMREVSASNFQVNTELRGGKGVVTVDALDMNGNFRNFLEFETTVLAPDMTPQKVTVRQVGPGRYEGTFEANQVGTYMVSMASTDGERTELTTSGASLSFSPEYAASRSNDDFLERLARESGGRVAGGTDYNAFQPHATQTRKPTALWPWLLLAGLCLVPADVFVRRVYWELGDLLKWLSGGLLSLWQTITFTRPKVVAERGEAMGSMLAAKQRAHSDRERKKEDEEARREFRERLEKADAPNSAEQGKSVFEAPAPNAAPTRARTKDTITASDGPDKPAGAAGIGGLLEAKKRAKKKME